MGLYACRSLFLSGGGFDSAWVDAFGFGSISIRGSRGSAAPAFRLLEPVAVAIHLKNVDVVGEPVEQGSGQALEPKSMSSPRREDWTSR